jgi:hypothetical protein
MASRLSRFHSPCICTEFIYVNARVFDLFNAAVVLEFRVTLFKGYTLMTCFWYRERQTGHTGLSSQPSSSNVCKHVSWNTCEHDRRTVFLVPDLVTQLSLSVFLLSRVDWVTTGPLFLPPDFLESA